MALHVAMAVNAASGLFDYHSRRRDGQSPFKAAAYAGAWFAVPTFMWAKELGTLAYGLGQAGYDRYRSGVGDNQQFYNHHAVGGGFWDTERSQMLRTQSLQRGMTTRQLLSKELGNEARRFYRGTTGAGASY